MPRALALLCISSIASLYLAACERLYLTSAVSAHALERHEVPALARVDRVEVTLWTKTYIPALSESRVADEPQGRMVTSSIHDPADISALVSLVNDNKWWVNPPLNLAPLPAGYVRRPDTRPLIVFWHGNLRMREVWVDGKKLVTKLDSRTVEHEMSRGEEEVVARVVRKASS